jgi:hypothetical protein
MNLPPISKASHGTSTTSSAPELDHPPTSLYLQYIGLAKYGNATTMLQKMMGINL